MKVHESEVSNPYKMQPLVDVAQRSGGLKMLRDDEGNFRGFRANNRRIEQSKNFHKWGSNPLEPTMEQAHLVRVMNPNEPARRTERGGPAEAGPRAPTGGEEMGWLDEGEGGGAPPATPPRTTPPPRTPGGPGAPPGGAPPGGTPPIPPP